MFAGVFGRRFNRLGIRPIVIAAGQATASTVVLFPIALAVDGVFEPGALGLRVWSALLGLGVLSTALAYVLYFKILEAAGATNVLLVTLLVPVSAILLGIVVLGERLSVVHIIGMALIGLGLSAIDGRLWRRKAGSS